MDNHNKNKKHIFYIIGLIFVALMWGLGFPFLKLVSFHLTTFYIIAIRFSVATVVLCLLFYKKLKLLDKSTIKSGFILSILLFLVYIFATIGIQYTTSAKASFFSCLGVVAIPFISKILFQESIPKNVIRCVAICTLGIVLMSYSKGMGLSLALGDIICLGCSISGALHIVYLGKLSKKHNTTLLAILQLAFISLYAFIIAFLIEPVPVNIPSSTWLLIIILGLFCTAFTYCMQTYCQQFIHPTKAGIIFAIEPLSGALFSVVLLNDTLGLNGYIGGAIIIASIVLMEIKNN